MLNQNRCKIIMIDHMIYLQFCIPYRENYEYNMSCRIIWMYYAYMFLRILCNDGMKIFSIYMYIIIYFIYFHFIIRISFDHPSDLISF